MSNSPDQTPTTYVHEMPLRHSSQVLALLDAARECGIARIVATLNGERVEIDRSDEIAEAARREVLEGLN